MMIKCFLSHSSKDKDNYVRVVSKNIRSEAVIYDEKTFESGMSPIEEIVNGLDESTLFVIFISNSSLNSEWVKEELAMAKKYLDDGKLKRIFPILIDSNLTYKDSRIPAWLQESTNIQVIASPNKAARKIGARLRAC